MSPYYFDEPTGSEAGYLHLLSNYFPTMLQILPPDNSFQQDGTLLHLVVKLERYKIRTYHTFGLHEEAQQISQLVLQTSLFLTFFIWRYVKDRVCRPHVSNVTQVKRPATSGIHEIWADIRQTVVKPLNERQAEVMRKN